ncbi:hypothetical protein Salat_1064500 [Sesamum alatum]|uniref:Uncharacterized protein n=1 Tax=Sesamum alatum TaxID=300844 RepID=A0AAE2CSM7_9LAMI|nr:hypothetical protein Salat_1064500 [Sesamum alatum]
MGHLTHRSGSTAYRAFVVLIKVCPLLLSLVFLDFSPADSCWFGGVCCLVNLCNRVSVAVLVFRPVKQPAAATFLAAGRCFPAAAVRTALYCLNSFKPFSPEFTAAVCAQLCQVSRRRGLVFLLLAAQLGGCFVSVWGLLPLPFKPFFPAGFQLLHAQLIFRSSWSRWTVVHGVGRPVAAPWLDLQDGFHGAGRRTNLPHCVRSLVHTVHGLLQTFSGQTFLAAGGGSFWHGGSFLLTGVKLLLPCSVSAKQPAGRTGFNHRPRFYLLLPAGFLGSCRIGCVPSILRLLFQPQNFQFQGCSSYFRPLSVRPKVGEFLLFLDGQQTAFAPAVSAAFRICNGTLHNQIHAV